MLMDALNKRPTLWSRANCVIDAAKTIFYFPLYVSFPLLVSMLLLLPFPPSQRILFAFEGLAPSCSQASWEARWDVGC